MVMIWEHFIELTEVELHDIGGGFYSDRPDGKPLYRIAPEENESVKNRNNDYRIKGLIPFYAL